MMREGCEEIEIEGRKFLLCYGCMSGGCFLEIRSPEGELLLKRVFWAG